MTIKVATWPWRIAPPPVSPVFTGRAIAPPATQATVLMSCGFGAIGPARHMAPARARCRCCSWHRAATELRRKYATEFLLSEGCPVPVYRPACVVSENGALALVTFLTDYRLGDDAELLLQCCEALVAGREYMRKKPKPLTREDLLMGSCPPPPATRRVSFVLHSNCRMRISPQNHRSVGTTNTFEPRLLNYRPLKLSFLRQWAVRT